MAKLNGSFINSLFTSKSASKAKTTYKVTDENGKTLQMKTNGCPMSANAESVQEHMNNLSSVSVSTKDDAVEGEDTFDMQRSAVISGKLAGEIILSAAGKLNGQPKLS